jgi:hypothetical protein
MAAGDKYCENVDIITGYFTKAFNLETTKVELVDDGLGNDMLKFTDEDGDVTYYDGISNDGEVD